MTAATFTREPGQVVSHMPLPRTADRSTCRAGTATGFGNLDSATTGAGIGGSGLPGGSGGGGQGSGCTAAAGNGYSNDGRAGRGTRVGRGAALGLGDGTTDGTGTPVATEATGRA